jgi:hypothetical protein
MKFTGFKYWLNEKFTEDSDPIHDMGIGIYREHKFKSEKEFFEWFYEIAPMICKVKDATQLVVSMNMLVRGPFLVPKYWTILRDYCMQYIKMRELPYTLDPYEFKNFIIRKNKSGT